MARNFDARACNVAIQGVAVIAGSPKASRSASLPGVGGRHCSGPAASICHNPISQIGDVQIAPILYRLEAMDGGLKGGESGD